MLEASRCSAGRYSQVDKATVSLWTKMARKNFKLGSFQVDFRRVMGLEKMKLADVQTIVTSRGQQITVGYRVAVEVYKETSFQNPRARTDWLELSLFKNDSMNKQDFPEVRTVAYKTDRQPQAKVNSNASTQYQKSPATSSHQAVLANRDESPFNNFNDNEQACAKERTVASIGCQIRPIFQDCYTWTDDCPQEVKSQVDFSTIGKDKGTKAPELRTQNENPVFCSSCQKVILLDHMYEEPENEGNEVDTESQPPFENMELIKKLSIASEASFKRGAINGDSLAEHGDDGENREKEVAISPSPDQLAKLPPTVMNSWAKQTEEDCFCQENSKKFKSSVQTPLFNGEVCSERKALEVSTWTPLVITGKPRSNDGAMRRTTNMNLGEVALQSVDIRQTPEEFAQRVHEVASHVWAEIPFSSFRAMDQASFAQTESIPCPESSPNQPARPQPADHSFVRPVEWNKFSQSQREALDRLAALDSPKPPRGHVRLTSDDLPPSPLSNNLVSHKFYSVTPETQIEDLFLRLQESKQESFTFKEKYQEAEHKLEASTKEVEDLRRQNAKLQLENSSIIGYQHKCNEKMNSLYEEMDRLNEEYMLAKQDLSNLFNAVIEGGNPGLVQRVEFLLNRRSFLNK
jgi:hypothetical protein